DGAAWPTVYVKWELGLLGELGFGLDLGSCAATGVVEDLSHVSPRSGRAVSRAAAEPYLDRLLPLPPFLLRPGALGGPAEVLDGLALAGHFLERHVFAPHGLAVPAARQRLVARLRRDGPAPDGL
ncbi:MAG: DNA repair protein RecO C-terminal domain-containing protein, partial [Hyphomicrobiales bacterium]|nr:DNA repair protein RecO C-terminal domain-containing protein [Hyphomicrobiales bacterium]